MKTASSVIIRDPLRMQNLSSSKWVIRFEVDFLTTDIKQDDDYLDIRIFDCFNLVFVLE